MNIKIFFITFLSLFLEASVHGCCNYCLNFFGCNDDKVIKRNRDTNYSSDDPLLHNAVSISTYKPLILTQVVDREAQCNTVPVGDIVIIEGLKRQYREGRVFTQQDLQSCKKNTPEYRFISQCLLFQMSNSVI